MISSQLGGPVVFIGHGPLTSQLKEWVERLYDGLVLAGFKPYLDLHAPEARAGAEFRQPLDDALWSCQASILVFTPAGIETSDWLPGEAFMMASRARAQQGKFVLITVFAEGASPGFLANSKWAPHRLDGREALNYDEYPDLERVVIERLRPLQERHRALTSPIKDVVSGVISILAGIGMDLARDIVDLSGSVSVASELVEMDPALAVALSLLYPRDLSGFGRSAVRLASTHSSVGLPIVSFCLPFVWLDESVARALCDALDATPARGAVAARTQNERTCRMILMRAAARPESWPLRVITEHVHAPIVDLVRNELVSHYFADGIDVSDERLQVQIVNCPCVVMLASPLPSKEAIQKLRDTFPGVLFLFGGVDFAELVQTGQEAIAYLHTLPDQVVEDEALTIYKRVAEAVDVK